ncbi:chromosome partitioning protein ParB [Cypionkella aquatica]|uniref:Chromosome partitioning protein ParB n=1 Tax=Cypionkella aquatica TaxID=1756042 RepID=A0AA37TY60_9RHOB|nr:ParB/RepB/Spo0J family partition protein [Cypionkella aquatica]GLS87720.1 chromosome partitioning protein ParB [Cypionkella aquatica]
MKEPPRNPSMMIPLSDLYVHALNARTEPPPEDIAALADSIAELGLLQNLAGFADTLNPEQTSGKVGIVAGGRRLRAILLLAAREGRDPATTTVPVRVTLQKDEARLWASAENTARQALHPADEVRAYARMEAAGADITKIARAFAVRDQHVRQRLRLAQLPERALMAMRLGEISLDQAAALTSARSDEALMAELNRITTSNWSTSAADIRNKLAADSIRADDRRAIYVGLQAYRDAGGQMLEDLFTDRVRLLDEPLLESLFTTKLAEAAAGEQSTGWKWVQHWTSAHPDWNAGRDMQPIKRVPGELPDGDIEDLDRLSDMAEQGDLSDDDQARFEYLSARAEGDYSDEDIATSGLWLYVDHHGALCTYGPYRRAQDDPNRESAGDDEAEGGTATSAKPESRALSASLLEDLKRIRLADLQLHAGERAELMLDLLAYKLSGELMPYSSPIHFTANPQTIEPEKSEGFAPPHHLLALDNAQHATISRMSPDGFTAFRALGKKHRNDVLARGLARLIGDNDLGPMLADITGSAVREIWTPTASAYFGRLPVSVMDEIWCTLVPDERTPDHATFRAQKKAEKAQMLHKLFNNADFREAIGFSREQNTRIDQWLPAELQWPAVEIATPEEQAA